jgi:hypothetical protein
VAKTRKKSAGKSRPVRRAGGAKKSARRKAAPRRGAGPRVLNLRKLQEDLRRAVNNLSSRASLSAAASAKTSDTQARLQRWAAEIDDICTPDEQEICGPTMDIPLN